MSIPDAHLAHSSVTLMPHGTLIILSPWHTHDSVGMSRFVDSRSERRRLSIQKREVSLTGNSIVELNALHGVMTPGKYISADFRGWVTVVVSCKRISTSINQPTDVLDETN